MSNKLASKVPSCSTNQPGATNFHGSTGESAILRAKSLAVAHQLRVDSYPTVALALRPVGTVVTLVGTVSCANSGPIVIVIYIYMFI